MNKRGFVAMTAALAVLLSVFAVPSFGAAKAVTVGLPNFSVTINGTVVNNDSRSYPFIVYRDITYFPMTYYDCRFLGLETQWDTKNGLAITKTGVTGAYQDYGGSKNKTSYAATIASFPIKVNGIVIDNSKEEYPLLNFRDVTYFPMSWKFAVNSFGWKYDFNNSKGLTINSAGSRAEKIGGLGTPKDHSEIALARGYLYRYQDGSIVAINYADPSDKKVLRQLGKNETGIQLGECSGELYFRVTDQNDRSVSFGPAPGVSYHVDASKRELGVIPDDTVVLGDIQVTAVNSQGHSADNLSVKLSDGTVKKIGDSKLHYLMDIYRGSILSAHDSIVRTGNDIVLLANDESGSEVLCKVNLQTGANTVLAKNINPHIGFHVDGGYAYATAILNDEGQIAKISLADGRTEYFGTKTSGGMRNNDAYGVLNGKVYYRNGSNMDRPPLQAGPNPDAEAEYKEWEANRFRYDEELYLAGNNISLSPEIRVEDIYSSGDYMVVKFDWINDKTQQDSKYTLMVLDKNGNTVFKTADKVFYAEVDGSTLIYGISQGDTGDYYRVSLK